MNHFFLSNVPLSYEKCSSYIRFEISLIILSVVIFVTEVGPLLDVKNIAHPVPDIFNTFGSNDPVPQKK